MSSQRQTATQRKQQTDRNTSGGGGRDKFKNVDGDFQASMRLKKRKALKTTHEKNESMKRRGGGRHATVSEKKKLKGKAKTAAAAMKVKKTIKSK